MVLIDKVRESRNLWCLLPTDQQKYEGPFTSLVSILKTQN